MENKEFAKRSVHCEYLVKKRHNNYDYIERAFCDAVFWMNSVHMTGEAIISMQEPSFLRFKTEQFFILSLNIAKLLDMGNVLNFVKALQQLFDEYQKYYSGETKLNPVILNTQTFLLQPTRKAFGKLKLTKEKQREILHSLTTNHAVIKDDENFVDATIGVFFPEEPDAPIEYKEFKTTHSTAVTEAASYMKVPAIKPKKTAYKNPNFQTLSLINVPFDLSFKEVVYSLCESMKMVYNKFFDIQSIDDGALKQIIKADQVMKKAVLQPLCDMIGDAAAWSVKHQIDSLFKPT